MGALVIGASAGDGRAIADQLGRVGTDLVIAARDDRDLASPSPSAFCRRLALCDTPPR